MKVTDLWFMAKLPLKRNRLRSFLASLGVLIGVLSISGMLTLGTMAQQSIAYETEKSGGKMVSVYPKFDPISGTKIAFNKGDLASLSSLPGEDHSAVQVLLSGAGFRGPENLYVTGVTNNLSFDKRIKIVSGRSFTKQELEVGKAVMIMSKDSVPAIFGNTDPVGKSFYIGRRFNGVKFREKVQVIGIYEFDSIFKTPDSGIDNFIPIQFYWNISNLQDKYDVIIKHLSDDTNINEYKKEFDAVLIKSRGEKNFRSYSYDPITDSYRNLIDMIKKTLALMGGLSLAVGGIGIMNIMLVNVSERKREIGIRKSFGAKRSAILLQFCAESVILTALGGIFGYVLSIILITIIAELYPNYFHKVIIAPEIAFLAIATSIVTGIVFGLWPAWQAASMAPAEALSHE